MVDLDLGAASDAAQMIQSLAPTGAAAPRGTISGLTLDLSTGEVADGAGEHESGTGVDLEIGGHAGRSSEPSSDEHVKVVGALRIGIPLFNIYQRIRRASRR